MKSVAHIQGEAWVLCLRRWSANESVKIKTTKHIMEKSSKQEISLGVTAKSQSFWNATFHSKSSNNRVAAKEGEL